MQNAPLLNTFDHHQKGDVRRVYLLLRRLCRLAAHFLNQISQFLVGDVGAAINNGEGLDVRLLAALEFDVASDPDNACVTLRIDIADLLDQVAKLVRSGRELGGHFVHVLLLSALKKPLG